MSIYSADYAKYYDALMGDDPTIIDTTKRLVQIYHKQTPPLNLLELGCGTGTILEQMPKDFLLTGLDISESMLQIAKKKVPHATYLHADMTNFKIPQKFDMILCIFDAINHLTTWTKWQHLFKNVAHHLSPHGIFIFDMNTMRRMALLATFKPYTTKLDKDTLAFVKIREKADNVYTGQFVVITDSRNEPQAIEQLIDEAVFPISTVEKELAKYFTIEKRADPYRDRVTGNTGRIFFVCRKV